MRLLFLSHRNWNFMAGILDHYSRMAPHVEVERLDVADIESSDGRRPAPMAALVRARLAAADPADQIPGLDAVAHRIRAADVVFVEWCARAAIVASLIDPGTTRVVVRLHSAEAFSLFPHLVD